MRTLRLLCLLILAAAFPPAAPRAAAPAAAPLLAGLSAPAEVITDRYGIPHIRAASLRDAYAAWGWVTARDRGWQLVISRAQAQGQTHRWLGNDALQADGGAQLFRLHERAVAIWQRERGDTEVRSALESFARGVNAYFEDCRAGRRAWPAEVKRLHIDPENWRPEDSVALLLGFGITLDLVLPEASEAKAIEKHGAAWVLQRRRFENAWPYVTVPDAAKPTGRAGAANVVPAPASGAALPHALPHALIAATARAVAQWPGADAEGATRASNEFAIGGGRTANGRPILANDPHLALEAPSPFYAVHVSVPGTMDAAGACVPGLPIVVSGHNTSVAWGVTALSIDVVDLYADTLDAEGTHVRYAGGWAPVTTAPYDLHYQVLGLSIPIPTFVQQRRYGPHGPIVNFDPKHHLAVALRWSAFEDARVTLRGLIGIERSSSAAEVTTRASHLVTPTLNFVAADAAGDVRYRACGLMPHRPYAFTPGLLPGDGRHEWAGYVATDSMPQWQVPRDAFVVNANNLPAGAAYAERLDRFDWAADRARRIAARLAGDANMTLADAVSVQNDTYSSASARQVPALMHAIEALNSLQPRELAALDSLRRWDMLTRRGRVAPTIARAWWNVYVRRARLDGLPGLALAALEGRASDALHAPGGDQPEAPAVAARAALDAALDSLTHQLGPDMSTWRYGRVHRARFVHALSDLDGRNRWEPTPTPVDGDGSTPSVGASSVPFRSEITHGPAWRMVVDLAHPDSALVVLPPWNSEDSQVPLLPDWADHRPVPLLTSWPRVQATARERVELRGR